MTVWRIFHLEGYDPNGRGIWREMGMDLAREEARLVVAAWRKAWPRHRYQLRKVHAA